MESLDDFTAVADPEDLLPIQQMTLSLRAGHDGLKRNGKRAAIVWGEFPTKADPSNRTLSLSSAAVRSILERARGSSHTQTVSRVMTRIEELSKGLVEVTSRKGTNYLVADLDDWEKRMSEVSDAVKHKESVLDA